MKSAVFARPNLKAILLGAILIAVVQNFLANGTSQATILHARGASKVDAPNELQQLLVLAETEPSAQVYGQISRHYEKQGDMRKALLYLRKAQLLAQVEEASD
jgi:hypothetical protein